MNVELNLMHKDGECIVGTLQIFGERQRYNCRSYSPCSSLHINSFQIDLIYMFNMLFYVRSLSWVSVCECLTLFWSSGLPDPWEKGEFIIKEAENYFLFDCLLFSSSPACLLHRLLSSMCWYFLDANLNYSITFEDVELVNQFYR